MEGRGHHGPHSEGLDPLFHRPLSPMGSPTGWSRALPPLLPHSCQLQKDAVELTVRRLIARSLSSLSTLQSKHILKLTLAGWQGQSCFTAASRSRLPASEHLPERKREGGAEKAPSLTGKWPQLWGHGFQS